MSITRWLKELAPAWYARKEDGDSAKWLETLGDLLTELRAGVEGIRRAWVLVTAPTSALTEHGVARRLPRYPGEDLDAYRLRLLDAFDLHLEAGTIPGMVRGMAALGFEDAEVFELFELGTKALYNGVHQYNGAIRYDGSGRIFEFDVRLPLAAGAGVDAQTLANVLKEIHRLKPAHTRLAALELQAEAGEPDAAPAPTDEPMTLTINTYQLYDGSIQYGGGAFYAPVASAQVVA